MNNSGFISGVNAKNDPVLGDPKASQWIQAAKDYLVEHREEVTIQKVKNLAIDDLNDPESDIDRYSFNRIIKQLKIEGVG